MSTKLSIVRDINGTPTNGILASTDIWAGNLAANTEQHFVVPSNQEFWLAIFTVAASSNVWMSTTATATVPGSSISQVKVILLNPMIPTEIQVKKGTTISLITADTTTPAFCVQLQWINNYASIS